MKDSLSLLKEALPWLRVQLQDHTKGLPEIEPLRLLVQRIATELEAAPERKCDNCEKLRASIRQMEEDHRDDMRTAAAQALHHERYPDEPYGTY